VREYWLVDPGRDAIVVCRQVAPGVLETTGELTAAAGGVLASPAGVTRKRSTGPFSPLDPSCAGAQASR
jgi:hypothetical protein